MSSVGLLYSAAALILNGLVLLGIVSGKAAAPFNLFVGGMQVLFPTLILIRAVGDTEVILSASAVYLFGFTYLYVAMNALTGATGEGLGWFSLFVATCAMVYSALDFASGSPVYGVFWIFWGILWFLFFLILARGQKNIQRTVGWFTLLLGIFTAGVPGFLELAGAFPNDEVTAIVAGCLCASLFALSWFLGRPHKAQLER